MSTPKAAFLVHGGDANLRCLTNLSRCSDMRLTYVTNLSSMHKLGAAPEKALFLEDSFQTDSSHRANVVQMFNQEHKGGKSDP